MTFAGGDKKKGLTVVGEVGKRNTGTSIRFWPIEKYFDLQAQQFLNSNICFAPKRCLHRV